ncbi:MAG: hypothetical protein A2172_04040 [Candidatus Woykebacteria bacterium RBG_13_40_15]|uniref:Uncharacterized protein n=1 Tax=Candidatus Woykebacteria bacterium RBG_13_40_15 TaxID=1802593 RepID=A0A1G1W6V9_9BACT|nr:MAG: hypothetical protein A2172_04040 [Candidatus Woykebacteria bacterium RBG_13_40_15]
MSAPVVYSPWLAEFHPALVADIRLAYQFPPGIATLVTAFVADEPFFGAHHPANRQGYAADTGACSLSELAASGGPAQGLEDIQYLPLKRSYDPFSHLPNLPRA